jgi:hypothetical protein
MQICYVVLEIAVTAAAHKSQNWLGDTKLHTCLRYLILIYEGMLINP